ncbi:MAG: site-specific DNA-methyltransferase [Cytophagales bacterium]|nr:MAG: site-specific DNA-methyltransferase [Cytophagales bacterium]
MNLENIEIKPYSLQEENYFLLNESEVNYLPQSEIDAVKEKKGFNGLSPTEWASLSKNVWNDLSSPRNEYQLEHGAVFPLKLADRLIKMYSNEGDAIFDPFAGIGTSLVAAQNLKRHAIGTELNPRFYELAEKWILENGGLFVNNFHYKLVNDDCRNLRNHIRPEKIQLTVTSPPYADFIQKSVKDRATTHKTSIIAKENNSTVKQYSENEKDFGNLPYTQFLEQIKEVLKANWEVTKFGGYSCWVVKDYRDTKNKIPYVPFHSDLARAGEEVGWKFHDLIVWDQSGQRRLILLGYPSVFYTNQNCSFIVIFRKVK